MGKSVKAPFSQLVPACFAVMTAIALMIVYIAPFYGALDPAVDINAVEGDISSGSNIIVEDFEYIEPELSAPDETPSSMPILPDVPVQEAQEVETQSLQSEQLEKIDLGLQTETDLTLVDNDEPMQMMHGAVVVAAGRIEGLGRIITLKDIVVTEVNQQCPGENGMNWNCGIHARTAFRAWLGGKTLSCRLPEEGDASIAVISECKIGQENPAAWLVQHGWVKAAEASDYVEMSHNAEDARRGIWGSRPISSMPELPLQPSPLQISDEPAARVERPSGYFPPALKN